MQYIDIIYFTGFLLGGFLISWICNNFLLRFSETLGIRNKNDVIVRWSNQSKPSLGGVSFFIVFIFSAFAYSVIFFEENIFHNKNFVGLFSAGSLAFLMGLADDAYNTRPLIKLFVQISCGAIFILAGVQIDLFHSFWPDAIITIIWVVTLMNSLNMLDNMDGITGTTVFFVLCACLVGNFITSGFIMDVWTLTILTMLGAILGFLYYNVHPSKLFMGDAGSQFIGLFVAFFTIPFLWNVSATYQVESWSGLILTLTALTPAAADTLTVVVNRLRKGKSPMVGGKDHTTHHLVYAGYNDKQVWKIFTLIGLLSFLCAIIIILLIAEGKVMPILFFLFFFLFVFCLLYRNTIKFPQK